jgi:hypothetical protein
MAMVNADVVHEHGGKRIDHLQGNVVLRRSGCEWEQVEVNGSTVAGGVDGYTTSTPAGKLSTEPK